eukprot:scaffold11602_cov123-Skeletonema_dohrnii-CCMP3373.AAC.4
MERVVLEELDRVEMHTYDKLKAGASLIQVYSMMVYEGPGVVSRIRKELSDMPTAKKYIGRGLRRGLGRGWRRRRRYAFEQH